MSTIKQKFKSFFSHMGGAPRIVLLASAAMLGLWLSTQYINKKGKDAPFHEIDWSPKKIIQALITEARDSVNLLTENFMSRRANEILKMRDTKLKSDSSTAGQKRIKDEAVFLQTRSGIVEDSLERKQLEALESIQKWIATRSDTAIKTDLSKRSALFIDVRDFSIDDYTFNKDSTQLTPAIKVTYVDPNLLGGRISGNIFLEVKSYPVTERFFNKYPGFALWTLLLIIQAILFCVLIVAFLFHLLSKSDNSLFTAHLEFNPGRTILILLSIVVLLMLLFFTLLNDEKGQLVSGKIFMYRLHSLFYTVNLLGYIASSFCLVGMINCVINLARLKKDIASNKEVESQAQPPDTNAQANNKSLDPAVVASLKKEIKQRFNLYFILTATILSLAIVTSGIFFSSMNNMDFIKQVTNDQGYSTVNSEMVYIYAIMNSFFLVLVYLPVRYLLDSLDKAIPPISVPGDVPPTGNEKKESFFSKLSDKLFGLKDLAIAASPILASLLQNLFDLLFK